MGIPDSADRIMRRTAERSGGGNGWRDFAPPVALAVALCGLGWAACRPGVRTEVLLSTTTSTRDAGLLDTLIPLVERATGYRVKTIAVGSGQALVLAGRGEVDVVLSHAPGLERSWLADGAVINRRLVMLNEFLVVGPPDDPAQVGAAASGREAFRRIGHTRARFVSRGDSSATHLLERRLWAEAGIVPDWEGHIESGQGMGATLLIAADRRAYALTDRATFLALRRRVALEPVHAGDPALHNVYHVLEVNPARFPGVNHAGARAFAEFLLSPEGQAVISTFGVDRFGEPLFIPGGGRTEDEVLRRSGADTTAAR
jgi:tungstate transport system substrate-binding protein